MHTVHDNKSISSTQVYLDNRKAQATRALESPVRTAELLLARGVRTVVVTTAATTASANCTLLQVCVCVGTLGHEVSRAYELLEKLRAL
jgi:hypothetical protein